jgi:hypothetical protein
MVELGVALGMVAPYYNLAMVLVVLLLFTRLFKTEPKAKVYLFPWILIFVALMVYILEEAITILRALGLVDIPIHINAFFELVIIATFIYALLSQRQYVKSRFG